MRAADAALSGPEPPDFGPAAALLSGWRFAAHPHLLERFVAYLGDHPPTLPTEDPSTLDLAAVALDRLCTLGRQVEEKQRKPWSRAYAADDVLDAEAAALWSAWVAGQRFEIADRWQARYQESLVRAYMAAVDGVGVSAAVRRQVLDELKEQSFHVLAGPREGTPGWRKVLARVVETLPGGPIAPLFDALGPVERRRFTDGVVERQYGRHTLALLHAEVGQPQLRADLSCDRYGVEDVEVACDLHVACRLVDTWREKPLGEASDWNIVTQNRGRIRTRLRALLAEGPVEQCWPLPQVEGLHDRTLVAVKRYGRAWAQSRRCHGFHPYEDAGVDPACTMKPDPRPPVDETDEHALRCWLAGLIISGHLERIDRWVHQGGAGDRSASFHRWQQALPAGLMVPGRTRDIPGYRHVRATLATGFRGWVRSVVPVLEGVAALGPAGPSRARAFRVALGEWAPDIRRPSNRDANIEHARAALATIRKWRDP